MSFWQTPVEDSQDRHLQFWNKTKPSGRKFEIFEKQILKGRGRILVEMRVMD